MLELSDDVLGRGAASLRDAAHHVLRQGEFLAVLNENPAGEAAPKASAPGIRPRVGRGEGSGKCEGSHI